jgi:hypothetical protein
VRGSESCGEDGEGESEDERAERSKEKRKKARKLSTRGGRDERGLPGAVLQLVRKFLRRKSESLRIVRDK